MDRETECLLNQYKSQYKSKPASWYFFPLAQIYCQAERFEEAIEICGQGLNNYPNLWAAKVVLAQAYLGIGKIEEAQAQLEAVVKELPNNLLASKLLAQVYVKQDKIGAALSRYRDISNFYPECTDLEETIRQLKDSELKQAQRMLGVLSKWQTALDEYLEGGLTQKEGGGNEIII